MVLGGGPLKRGEAWTICEGSGTLLPPTTCSLAGLLPGCGAAGLCAG